LPGSSRSTSAIGAHADPAGQRGLCRGREPVCAVVTEAGNAKAQAIMDDVFVLRDTLNGGALGKCRRARGPSPRPMANSTPSGAFTISEKQSRETKIL
jgi:hypothetical protein